MRTSVKLAGILLLGLLLTLVVSATAFAAAPNYITTASYSERLRGLVGPGLRQPARLGDP